MAVNCIASSPTFGGVYELTDGVGLNRIASSLTEFLDAGAAAIAQGFIRYDDGMLLPVYPRFLLEAGTAIRRSSVLRTNRADGHAGRRLAMSGA